MSAALSKAECLKRGIEWTPAREKRYNEVYLGEKRRLFIDFNLPFPIEFEDEFYELFKQKGDEAYRAFDARCSNRLAKNLDNLAEVWVEFLKRKYHGKTFYDYELKKKVGKYVLSEIEKSGLIEPVKVFRGANVYQF